MHESIMGVHKERDKTNFLPLNDILIRIQDKRMFFSIILHYCFPYTLTISTVVFCFFVILNSSISRNGESKLDYTNNQLTVFICLNRTYPVPTGIPVDFINDSSAN